MAEARRKGLKVTEDQAKLLAIPKISLPSYGYLSDLNTSRVIKFDEDAVTYKLQSTLVSYFSDPSLIPDRLPAETYWIDVLKSRQSGSTNTCMLCEYAMVSYTPAMHAAIAADKTGRAKQVFDRLNLAYERWDPAIRTDRETKTESNSLTTQIGSKVSVHSAQTPDFAVGLSVDVFVGSELPLWENAGGQLSALIPSMMNRMSSKMVLESTPQPLSSPSGQWWMDHWLAAVNGQGRWRAAFMPYWDSKANTRPWPRGDVPTNDELRLLERFGIHNESGLDEFGHPGLTLDNLAFRRWAMESDEEIRRMPELFDVWYPPDDQRCWIEQGLGVVPAHAIDWVLAKELQDEKPGYNEFPENWNGRGTPAYEVNPNAVYLACVDPAGFLDPTGKNRNDHHAFHILEIWDDEWIQVASFGGHMDPLEFMDFVIDKSYKFNTAKLAIEYTGVGHLHAGLAKQDKYPNLYYGAPGKPGIHKGDQQEWLGKLVSALMDKRLTIRGKQTAMQVKGYRHDKMNQRSARSETMHPETTGGRRLRGHWDKVSALMVGCVVAPKMPRRYKPVQEPENVIPFNELSWNQHQEHQAYLARLNQPKRKLSYRRRRG